jgi:hypothetical protein
MASGQSFRSTTKRLVLRRDSAGKELSSLEMSLGGLFCDPRHSGGSFFGLGRAREPEKAVFDFRAHFCHSAPVGTHAFGYTLPAQHPEGQKRFPISQCKE